MRDAMNNPPAKEGWEDGKGRYLIDGFPRKMDQALKFDEAVCGFPRQIMRTLTSLGLPIIFRSLLRYDRGCHARKVDGEG